MCKQKYIAQELTVFNLFYNSVVTAAYIATMYLNGNEKSVTYRDISTNFYMLLR